MNPTIGVLLISVFLISWGGAHEPTAPAHLPLEQIAIEPGERLRIKLPPDQNAGPAETNPHAFAEFVITDALGKPVRATVTVDGVVSHRDVDRLLLVMTEPSRQTMVKVSAAGYEPWELGLRLNLKHTRRFQFPIMMQSLTLQDNKYPLCVSQLRMT